MVLKGGHIIPADHRGIEYAVDILRKGGVVITPTITNYNLVCDATNENAVRRVFAIKRRTKFGPLPVTLPQPRFADYFVNIPERYQEVIYKLLPGEISFILWEKYKFPTQLSASTHTIAISCSTHPVLRSLAFGVSRPLAATSANISGQGNILVTLNKAIEDIGKDVDLILDGGPTLAELSEGRMHVNTIIDLTFSPPFVCREGWISIDIVRRYVPDIINDPLLYQQMLSQRITR